MINLEESKKNMNNKLCFTGQPFLDKDELTVACPVCNKALSLRGTSWFDSHYEPKFKEGSKGTYVCKEHLSDKRKAEINADRITTNPMNFDNEKDWVAREQVSGPDDSPLVSALNTVAKYVGDPEIMDGVKKLFQAVDEVNNNQRHYDEYVYNERCRLHSHQIRAISIPNEEFKVSTLVSGSGKAC